MPDLLRIASNLLALAQRRREVEAGLPPSGNVVVWRRCMLVSDVDMSAIRGAVEDECSACGRAIWITLTQPQPFGREVFMCGSCCMLGLSIRATYGAPVIPEELVP